MNYTIDFALNKIKKFFFQILYIQELKKQIKISVLYCTHHNSIYLILFLFFQENLIKSDKDT